MSTDNRRGILFVCTGNVCRSPYLEYSLRAALLSKGHGSIPISSAGTAARDGELVAAPVLEALRDRGIDARSFRSHRLNSRHIASAGLIVTATRAHRTDVVRLDALAETRTFTLFQLLRMLDASVARSDLRPEDALLDAVVSRALAARGLSRGGEDDDIEDPWRRSRRVYDRVIRRMDGALATLVNYFPTTP